MKIAYTLTWDEFKEIYDNSWPRPKYFSVIASAIVALPLIGYGISLLLLGNLGPDGFVAYMFIGPPLLLLLAAVATLKPQWKKTMALAAAEKRLEYERRFAQEQSFSFDQERWIHETAAGRQEVPWRALLLAFEHQSIWHLFGENTRAIVPKRAMDQASADALRQLAFTPGVQKWPLPISVWDYQASQTAILWRKYRFSMAFGNVFGAGILLWAAYIWLTTHEKIGLIWGWILAAFAVALTLAAQLWYFPLLYAISPRSLRVAKALSLSDRGICVEDSSSGGFMAWKSFYQFQEIGRAFLIYSNTNRFYLVPKRCLSPEQQSELRRYLENNLKPDEKLSVPAGV